MKNIEKFEDVEKITDICHCECHQDGRVVMHCCPCCNLTYEKYISAENGKINLDRYKKLLKNYTKMNKNLI
jgi:hypothetical protein